MSFLRVNCDAARGLQCPKESRKIWTGRKSIGDIFFQTTMTQVINFFASFPVVKQEHVEGFWLLVCHASKVHNAVQHFCIGPHVVPKRDIKKVSLRRGGS